MTRTNNRASANGPSNAVSVKDFGAQGDGVVNDSPAIKKALEWLFSEQNSQKSLYVPSGIYNLEETIDLGLVNPKNSQLAIYGDGATSVFHCNDRNGGIKITAFAPTIYLTLDSLQFCPGTDNGGTAFAFWFTYDNPNTKNRHMIWMRNCVVDTLIAENRTDGWVDVFKFHGASRIKIQDTTVWNYWNEVDETGNPVGKMIDLTDCYKPWLEDLYVNGAGAYGVYNVRKSFNEGGNYNNVNVVGPVIGIYIAQDTTLGGTGRHPEVWIKNSHLNCKAMNIRIEGCKYVWVKDCLLYSAPSDYSLTGSPEMIDVYVKDSVGVNMIGNIFGSGSLEVMDRRHAYIGGVTRGVLINDSVLDASCEKQPFYFQPDTSNITFHQPTIPTRDTYMTNSLGEPAELPGYLTQGGPEDTTYVYRYEVYDQSLFIET